VKGSLHFINRCQTIQLETFLNRGKLLRKDHASRYLDDPTPALPPGSESLIGISGTRLLDKDHSHRQFTRWTFHPYEMGPERRSDRRKGCIDGTSPSFLPVRFSCFSEQSRFPDSLHVNCQDSRAAAIRIGHIWVNESNPGAERFSDLKKPLFVEKACRSEGLECL